MPSSPKFHPARVRLWPGILVAGLAFPAPPGWAATPAPAIPVITLPPWVTQTTERQPLGYVASVPRVDGLKYAWTVTGGYASLGGANSSSITFRPLLPGTLTLKCTVTSGSGLRSAGSGTTQVVAAPVARILAPRALPAGAKGIARVPTQPRAGYAWTITGGTADSGTDAATLHFTAGASGQVGLACTVTNQAGTTASDSARVRILAPPDATVTLGAPGATLTPGATYSASVPSQPRAHYAWSIAGSGAFLPGTPLHAHAVSFAAGASGTVTLTCKVTRFHGPFSSSATGSASASIGATAPRIGSLGFAQGTVPAGSDATLVWTLANASSDLALVLDQGVGPVTGLSATFPAPQASGSYVYTLKASNAAGSDTLSATLNVTSVLTSFTADTLRAPVGGSVHLTGVFAGGAGTVTPNVGALTSGVPMAVTPAYPASTYTLTVANGAGAAPLTATQTVTVVPGLFRPSGDALGTARTGHTSTLLPDGRVVLVGGLDPRTGAPLGSVEIHDPTLATAPVTLNLATARSGHTATLLPNGSVLVAGGTGASGPLTSLEVLDPGASTVTTVPLVLGTPRTGHTATLLGNGTVLMAAGSTSSTAEILDPVRGTSTPVSGGMAAIRFGHTATALPDGTVLIAGGAGTSGTVVNSAEVFDPARLPPVFEPALTMSDARTGGAAVLLANPTQVMLVGGTDGSNLVAPVALFTPNVGRTHGIFARGPVLGTPRNQPSATLLPDGQVLVAGGADASGQPLGTAEVLDPGRSAFTALASTLTPSRSGATATLLPSGLVLLAGGAGGTPAVAEPTLEVFDPQDLDAQFQLAPIPAPAPDPDATLQVPANPLGLGGSYSASLGNLPSPDPAAPVYAWSVVNGSLAAVQGPAIQFGATAGGTLTVNLLATSSLGIPSHWTASLPVLAPVAAPAIHLEIGGNALVVPADGVTYGILEATPFQALVTSPQPTFTYAWQLTTFSTIGGILSDTTTGTGASIRFPGYLSGGLFGTNVLSLTCTAADTAQPYAPPSTTSVNITVYPSGTDAGGSGSPITPPDIHPTPPPVSVPVSGT